MKKNLSQPTVHPLSRLAIMPHQKKLHAGWININPFRGLMVLGTPGSGKSESVIIPFIKQFLAKGYAMMVYDFKYPTLARLTYYHYLKHHIPGGSLEHHDFHVVNPDDISYSQRINPMDAAYIKSLADVGKPLKRSLLPLKKERKDQTDLTSFSPSLPSIFWHRLSTFWLNMPTENIPPYPTCWPLLRSPMKRYSSTCFL